MLPVPEYTDYVGLSEMAIREPRTKQEKDKAKRLWKAYRWTWATYWAWGVKQGWKCGICGRSAKNMPLNVDHEHFKVQSRRVDATAGVFGLGFRWMAYTVVQGRSLMKYAKTKMAAEAALREDALPLSVRGLLCPGRHRGCNRLLGRIDNPNWLMKALAYVQDPPAHGLV